MIPAESNQEKEYTVPKVKALLRRHRVTVFIIIVLTVYTLGHFLKLHAELFGKGTEMLIESGLEAMVGRFLGTED